ncbi:MAG: DNA-packaging protein [Rikenellaceae bacterium]|nr:DNA-packaging protein [Rikenellaceae bacterium]
MERLTGNQLWKLRTKHGRDRLFGDAALLWDEACKYFDWADRHPREKVELVKYKGEASEAEVPLGRMYSMHELTVYLGVSGSYFRTAKGELREKIEKGKATAAEVELLETIERIEGVIQADQISGAAVGIYATQLVNRLNGLSDNVNVTNNQPVVKVSVRDAETDGYLAELDDLL